MLLIMKQLFNALKIFGIVFTIALLSSCEKKYFVAPTEEIKDVSYATDMQPFFDAKCVSCHGGNIPPNLTSPGSYDVLQGTNNNGEKYVDTDNPEGSVLYTTIIPGGSMDEYANATEREMTLVWITEGAKDN